MKQRLKELIGRDQSGRLKHKMFRRLTKDIGDPKLREHLAAVVALMKASDTWPQFMQMLDRSLKRYKPLPLFDGRKDRTVQLTWFPVASLTIRPGVLGEALALALVHIEALLNIVLGCFDRHQAGGKLHVTVLADAEQGMATDDPKFSLCSYGGLGGTAESLLFELIGLSLCIIGFCSFL